MGYAILPSPTNNIGFKFRSLKYKAKKFNPLKRIVFWILGWLKKFFIMVKKLIEERGHK